MVVDLEGHKDDLSAKDARATILLISKGGYRPASAWRSANDLSNTASGTQGQEVTVHVSIQETRRRTTSSVNAKNFSRSR